MTFREYLYRLRAHRLARVDAEYDIHLSAFLNARAGATKKQGDKQVYVYPSMKDFFDYDKRVAEIEGGRKSRLSPQQKRMAQIAAEINSK